MLSDEDEGEVSSEEMVSSDHGDIEEEADCTKEYHSKQYKNEVDSINTKTNYEDKIGCFEQDQSKAGNSIEMHHDESEESSVTELHCSTQEADDTEQHCLSVHQDSIKQHCLSDDDNIDTHHISKDEVNHHKDIGENHIKQDLVRLQYHNPDVEVICSQFVTDFLINYINGFGWCLQLEFIALYTIQLYI